jgi:hypothetical protein
MMDVNGGGTDSAEPLKAGLVFSTNVKGIVGTGQDRTGLAFDANVEGIIGTGQDRTGLAFDANVEGIGGTIVAIMGVRSGRDGSGRDQSIGGQLLEELTGPDRTGLTFGANVEGTGGTNWAVMCTRSGRDQSTDDQSNRGLTGRGERGGELEPMKWLYISVPPGVT